MAYGALQFWEETFDGYSDSYGMNWLDYKNPVHQIKLADEMLKEDFNNVRHWTTYPKCANGLDKNIEKSYIQELTDYETMLYEDIKMLDGEEEMEAGEEGGAEAQEAEAGDEESSDEA